MHRDSLAAGLYAENATLMPPNHAPVKGRAAIRTFIKEFPRLQRFTASPIEIEGRGDLAYVRGSYQMTFESGATDFGKFLEIRRHQADVGTERELETAAEGNAGDRGNDRHRQLPPTPHRLLREIGEPVGTLGEVAALAAGLYPALRVGRLPPAVYLKSQ